MAAASAVIPAAVDAPSHPDTNKGEPQKGNCEGSEVTGADVAASVASDDGGAAEEGTAGKETNEAAVKSEGEEWSQPEPNPPCLGGCLETGTVLVLSLSVRVNLHHLLTSLTPLTLAVVHRL